MEIRKWPLIVLFFLSLTLNCAAATIDKTEVTLNMRSWRSGAKALWYPGVRIRFGYFEPSLHIVSRRFLTSYRGFSLMASGIYPILNGPFTPFVRFGAGYGTADDGFFVSPGFGFKVDFSFVGLGFLGIRFDSDFHYRIRNTFRIGYRFYALGLSFNL